MDLPHHSVTQTSIYFELEAVADATLLVDNHAHPLSKAAPSPLWSILSEAATTPSYPHPACATLAYSRAIRDISGLLANEMDEPFTSQPAPMTLPSSNSPSPPSPHTPTPIPHSETTASDDDEHALESPSLGDRAIEQRRATLGVTQLATRCFGAAGIAAVLVDDGLNMPEQMSLSEMKSLGIPLVRRVVRVETEAESVLKELVTENKDGVWRREGRPTSPDKKPRTTIRATMFRQRLHQRLSSLPENVVAFKSIAAYRSGLGIDVTCPDEVLDEVLRETVSSSSVNMNSTESFRLTNKVIIDCVVHLTFQIAKLHHIPVQFHCGMGDIDERLEQANPLLLKPLMDEVPDVKVVLLHASWPYVREAAYLTAVYPNCFLDFGLAIPTLSVRGMFRALDAAMEIAPVTKLLYSSDAHTVPDAYYLAARWGRRVVAAAVAANVQSGDLTVSEGKAAVRKILAENATGLYRLPVQAS